MKTRNFTPMRNPVTNFTVPSGGPRPICGLFSTFHWATRHLLLWAVFAASVAWMKHRLL